MAKQLVDIASKAGANYVKFQTFKADSLVTSTAEKADYQKTLTDEDESQFEMIKKLELNRAAHEKLIEYCKKKNIQFLSTPFDCDSIDLLEELEIPIFKIPSGEITNIPYLRYIGSKGKPIIMSTGMATLDEVREAMEILLIAGIDKKDLTILHCNTEYPTPFTDVNLLAMLTIKKELNVDVGYSDHTLGIEAPIAAVAIGAKIIEKHFTIDRNLPGPDHAASLEPNELIDMIKAIRNIDIALGDGIKMPSVSEKKNIAIARKSIVANKTIDVGDVFSEKNLVVKRPGTGISPKEWDNLIGKKSNRKYKPDDLIQ